MPFRYNMENKGAQVAYVVTANNPTALENYAEKHGGRVTHGDKSPFGLPGDRWLWVMLGRPAVEFMRARVDAGKSTVTSAWEVERADVFCWLNGHKPVEEREMLRHRITALAADDVVGLTNLKREVIDALHAAAVGPPPKVKREHVSRDTAGPLDQVRAAVKIARKVKLTDAARAVGLNPDQLARLVAADRSLLLSGGRGRGKVRYIKPATQP